MFLLDTHVHTKEVSPCGQTDAKTLIAAYKKAGYNGLIITDHLSSYYPVMRSNISWKEKIDLFFSGYEKAASWGSAAGMLILPGFELSFTDDPNDYLVYGISKAWLYEHQDIQTKNINYFSQLISTTNALIIQAHPFRKGMRPMKAPLIQGIEVFNGNPRHDSENHRALIHAARHKLIQTSGSDFHRIEDCARGGMLLKKPISQIDEFIEILKSEVSELKRT